MKIKDILQIDLTTFLTMSTKELKNALKKLAYEGNRRIKRLKEGGYETPASQYKPFSVKGDLNKLRNEFVRARKFFQLKTSSVKGAKQVEKALYNRMRIPYPRIRTEQFIRQTKKFWEVYRKLQELYDIGGAKDKHMFDSSYVQKLIVEVTQGSTGTGATKKDLRDDVEDILKAVMEEIEESE